MSCPRKTQKVKFEIGWVENIIGKEKILLTSIFFRHDMTLAVEVALNPNTTEPTNSNLFFNNDFESQLSESG